MFKTIRSKLVFSFLTSILISILTLSLIMSSVIGKTIKEEFIASTNNEIIKVEQLVNTYFSEMFNNARMLASNSTVKKADSTITSYKDKTHSSGEIKSTPLANGGIEADIYKEFENFALSHPNIDDIFIGTLNGSYLQYAEGSIASNYDPTQRPWYLASMDNPGEVIQTGAYYWAGADASRVGITSTISNNSNQVIGSLAMEVALDDLTDMVANLKVGKDGYIILVEDSGTILSHPKHPDLNFTPISESHIKELGDHKDGSFDIKDDGIDYITNIHISEENGWKYIAVVPKSELSKQTNLINIAILLLGVFVILISLIVSFIISSRLSKPIQRVRDLMKQVENGNFTVQSDIKGKDEIAQLSSSFNNMTQNIRKLIQNSKHISIDVTNSSDELAQLSNQVSIIADEVSHAIVDLSSEAYKQSQQTDGIVEAIDSFTNEIESVSKTMDGNSSKASDLASYGITIVDTLEETTTENVKYANQVSDAISVLDEKSRHIEGIINIIKHISEDTALLALNASIEAARAGEAGKGFGVVASEIRTLADNSKISTRQIEAIISEIQAEIHTSVSAMEKSNQSIEENTQIVTTTKAAFTDIVKIITSIREEVQMLNELVIKMTVEKEQISEKVARIADASQIVAATSEEITASSEEQTSFIHTITSDIHHLKDLSSSLEDSISKFYI